MQERARTIPPPLLLLLLLLLPLLLLLLLILLLLLLLLFLLLPLLAPRRSGSANPVPNLLRRLHARERPYPSAFSSITAPRGHRGGKEQGQG